MTDLTVKQLCEQSHALAKEKGWWDKDEALIALANSVLSDPAHGDHHKAAMRVLVDQRDEPRKIPEKLMLLVSEISEALESHRRGEPLGFYECERCPPSERDLLHEPTCPAGHVAKPEGLAAECADVAIRLGDFCQRWGIDLERAIREKHAFNRTRPQRHGGKAC